MPAVWPVEGLYPEVPVVPDMFQGVSDVRFDTGSDQGQLVMHRTAAAETGSRQAGRNKAMSWSDPIADMLTRIRNALKSEMPTVEMPSSRMKIEMARVLKEEGYVADFSVESRAVGKCLKVYLKYTDTGEAVIRGMRRESKPGLRRYVTAHDLPRVLGGLGTAILSTSQGVMTGKEAGRKNVGGEFLCSVW
jgi:small subunit ribosomal protein S8